MQAKKLTIVNFGARFQKLVADSGLSQKELAATLGLSEGSLVNYKRGRIPKAEELLAIASYFSVSLKWLLTGEEQKGLQAARIEMLGNFNALARQVYPQGSSKSSEAETLESQMLHAVEPVLDLLEGDLNQVAHGSSKWQTSSEMAEAKLAATKKGLMKILDSL